MPGKMYSNDTVCSACGKTPVTTRGLCHSCYNKKRWRSVNGTIVGKCTKCGKTTYTDNPLCYACDRKEKAAKHREEQKLKYMNLVRESKNVTLSFRQQETLDLLARGYRESEIAKIENISRQAVNYAISGIEKKINKFNKNTIDKP